MLIAWLSLLSVARVLGEEGKGLEEILNKKGNKSSKGAAKSRRVKFEKDEASVTNKGTQTENKPVQGFEEDIEKETRGNEKKELQSEDEENPIKRSTSVHEVTEDPGQESQDGNTEESLKKKKLTKKRTKNKGKENRHQKEAETQTTYDEDRLFIKENLKEFKEWVSKKLSIGESRYTQTEKQKEVVVENVKAADDTEKQELNYKKFQQEFEETKEELRKIKFQRDFERITHYHVEQAYNLLKEELRNETETTKDINQTLLETILERSHEEEKLEKFLNESEENLMKIRAEKEMEEVRLKGLIKHKIFHGKALVNGKQKEIDNLIKTINEAEKEKETLDTENKILSKMNNDYKVWNATLHEKLLKNQKKRTELKFSIIDLETEKEIEKIGYTEKATALEKEIKEANEESIKLNKEKEEIKDFKERIERRFHEKEIECDRLNANLKNLIKKSKRKLHKKELSMRTYRSELKKLQEDYENLTTKNLEFTEKVRGFEELSGEREKIQATLSEALNKQRNYEELIFELNKRVSEKEALIEELTTVNDELLQKNLERNGRVLFLEDARDKMEETIKEKTKSEDLLRGSYEEIKRQNDLKIEKFQEELRKQRQELGNKEAELKKLLTKPDEETLLQIQQAHEESSILKTKVEEMRRDKDNLKKNMVKLEKRIRKLRQENRKFKSMETKSKKLERDLKTSRFEIKNLKKSERIVRKQLKITNEKRVAIEKALELQEKKEIKTRVENSSQTEESNQKPQPKPRKDNNIEELKRSQKKISLENEALRTANDSLRDKIKSLEADIISRETKLRDLVKKLRDEKEKLADWNKDLQEEEIRLKEVIGKLENKNEDLEKDLINNKRLIEELRRKVRLLETDKENNSIEYKVVEEFRERETERRRQLEEKLNKSEAKKNTLAEINDKLTEEMEVKNIETKILKGFVTDLTGKHRKRKATEFDILYRPEKVRLANMGEDEKNRTKKAEKTSEEINIKERKLFLRHLDFEMQPPRLMIQRTRKGGLFKRIPFLHLKAQMEPDDLLVEDLENLNEFVI